MENKEISFGDRVRIKRSQITEQFGFAGLEGVVYGETTPSITSVDVIGDKYDDYAINVYFDEKQDSFWFTADLLEFIDHNPGSVASLNNSNKEFVRLKNGEWQERTKTNKRPWWKFW